MLVEADGERLSALTLPLERRQEPLSWRHAVLAAETEADVLWHWFSDHRLDGPLGMDGWQSHYPNVKLLAEQRMVGTRLDTLLEGWPQAQSSTTPLQLLVRQGDPLGALQGAGLWLVRLERVELLGPRAAEIWGEALDAWLVARGFCRQEGRKDAWLRDPLATRLLELEELQQERDQLATQLAQIRLEVDAMAERLGSDSSRIS
ncbi:MULTISPECIES: hypothetical protein [unclassified Cyanobium]|uniref:hypothetical protein n=1 Tax=unclassified Cyanobium TaxID=2627006 RepID=UPI0020CC0978|nr:MULTISPECIES: hypothetical protein [unclassified Cyanobium]MCP9835100.1 hypothetical protein [Cyanobium sp. La Preciosa 7G6]MCP9937863.1 hypothetical protein [Cyanobium sp. Aljojuca 7A6]